MQPKFNQIRSHAEFVESYCSEWNSRERILLLIVCLVTAAVEYLICRYPLQFWKVNSEILRGILYFAQQAVPLGIVYAFAQVARKKNFVIISASVWLIVSSLYDICNYSYVVNDFMHFALWRCGALCLIILLEVFYRKFILLSRSNVNGSIVAGLISVFISVIIDFVISIISRGSVGDIPWLIYEFIAEFVVIALLSVAFAAILRAAGLPKFINPKREEMQL